MDAKELIKKGNLSEARAHLIEAVKKIPTDAGNRTLLLQVMAFCGEWDTAATH